MKIKLAELNNQVKKILKSTYYSEEEAALISEVLLYAEMTGKNTQGVLKLLGGNSLQSIKPEHEPRVVKETRLSALIDGGKNPGILVSRLATKIAVAKCKEMGFGIVGTKNTFSSTGVIGFYAREIAQNDFLAEVMAGSPGGVTPHGGKEPLFGTNPIAFGFPTTAESLVFDMATAAITWYGLVRAKALGQTLPENVAIDIDGSLTTDPEKAMKGAILPFDRNYKGSGLSMMIEILTGPLVGASFADPKGVGDWGNLFIAIDPDLLTGREEFKKNCSELITKVRSSQPRDAKDNVKIPGEESLRNLKIAQEKGEIEIDDKIYKELQEQISR